MLSRLRYIPGRSSLQTPSTRLLMGASPGPPGTARPTSAASSRPASAFPGILGNCRVKSSFKPFKQQERSEREINILYQHTHA